MLDPERLRRADRLLGALYSRAISEFWKGGRLVRRVSRGALVLFCAGVLAAVGVFVDLVASAGDRVRPVEPPEVAWQRIASRIDRPIRGRLSFASRYRPCPEAAAICGALPSPASSEFMEAATLLARLAQEPVLDAATLHAEALARLTLRGSRTSEALPLLEAAAALAPSDLRIAADLLAVRLAHAEDLRTSDSSDGGAARQVVRAVLEAVRLSEVAADEPAVWFNYALVFEAVGLPRTAAAGWRRFLELEPDGEWASEARQRLVAAATEPPQQANPPLDPSALVQWAEAHPLSARRYLERDVLAAWAADPDGIAGQRALSLAEPLAEIVVRHFRDSTVAESVTVLRSSGASQRRRLATGFDRYMSGLDAYGSQRFTDALREFTAARAELDDLPFRGWADYQIAVSLYGLDRFDEAGGLLRAMEIDVDRQQVLESRRLWLLGLVEGSLGRLRGWVTFTEGALAILVQHPDMPAIASMSVNLAEALDQLAQHDRAWFHRLQGLQASARLGSHRLRHIALLEFGSNLIDLHEPEAALPFLVELGANAVDWDVPTARLEAALLHASALSSAGRHEEAVQQLRLAVEAAGELKDQSRIERLGADIAVEHAEVLLASEPARALEELDGALATYRRFSYRYPLVHAHRLRGIAAMRLGMTNVAGDAFRAAVATHEEVLALLEEPDHRAGYLAHANDAYEALVHYMAVEEGDAAGAFDVLQRSRSTWHDGGLAKVDGVADIQARLPEASALIAYRVMANEMLVWWIGTRERDFQVVPIARQALEDAISRHEAEMALTEGPVRAGSATGWLYEILFAPVEARLSSVRRLYVLPDQLLDRVGIPALVAAGARLDSLESLSLASAAQHPNARPSSAAGGVVAVGNPDFDEAAFPDLGPLPAASREAREVAALYPDSVTLIGKEANASRIEEELGGRRVLHYAGHAVFVPLDPERSGLVLAPQRGDDGILTIGEIEALSLRGLDLVVLSACRTSSGDRPASQDWAGALLNAGVQGVVANRWEIDDEAAHRFLLRFHEHRVAGLRDAEALLAAQRDFRNEPPRVWAGFSYYGTVH